MVNLKESISFKWIKRTANFVIITLDYEYFLRSRWEWLVTYFFDLKF